MRETDHLPEPPGGEARPELGPLGDGGDGVLMRSEDGRADLVMGRDAGGAYELRSFRCERTAAGLDSAWGTMDDAEAAGALPPAALEASIAPHPDYVDLLRDEPAGVAFWRERAAARPEVVRIDVASEGGERDEAIDVARRMHEDSEHRTEVTAFDPPERWVHDINAPGAEYPGRDYNCVFCGLATEQRWRGEPVRAGEWPHEQGLSVETTQELVGPLTPTSPEEVHRTLDRAGPGSSGIVVVNTVSGGGHMLNVVNDGGTVRWVDGQQGTIDTEPPSFAISYRWTARDREGRRL